MTGRGERTARSTNWLPFWNFPYLLAVPPSTGAREVLLVRAAHGAYPRSKRADEPLTPRVRSVRGSENTSLDPALGNRSGSFERSEALTALPVCQRSSKAPGLFPAGGLSSSVP